jgi:hypothetical protein
LLRASVKNAVYQQEKVDVNLPHILGYGAQDFRLIGHNNWPLFGTVAEAANLGRISDKHYLRTVPFGWLAIVIIR